ncbi:hypothetical protein BG005_002708, partial [Podila minutissima]
MVHHKLKDYLAQHHDLLSADHFGFFESAPELSEVNACSIWIAGLTEMAQDSNATRGASLELLKKRYVSDKKNGALKQYWSDRELEREEERSQKQVRIQTNITVNRTTTRVIQSAEKNASDNLQKRDTPFFPEINIGDGDYSGSVDVSNQQEESSKEKRKRKSRYDPDPSSKSKYNMGRRSTLSADGEGFGSETYIEAASFQVYKYEIGECNVGRLFNKFQVDSASIVNNFDISATLTNVSKFLHTLGCLPDLMMTLYIFVQTLINNWRWENRSKLMQ